ncbi:MAG: hypothetical protein KKC18_10320 [Chloroflexi bacterium]|nr:hypothetical protein [Chloroflexota bacterium]
MSHFGWHAHACVGMLTMDGVIPRTYNGAGVVGVVMAAGQDEGSIMLMNGDGKRKKTLN